MTFTHKPLNKQVVLITGASSGIGRQSAVRFGKSGAKVVVVSRNLDALQTVVEEIVSAGGEAIAATADVSDIEQLSNAAANGVARFGRIDTWVNNAGVGMYAKLLETELADDRRLFETNFWGIVNGSRVAVPYLKAAGGGALVNLGSEVSDISIPVQGMYATSKHAVMGFTDALRDELMAENAPISVTLIKPASINTPYPHHAKNYTDKEGTLPSPVYAVDLVADQILHAAVYGGRDLYAGGGGRLVALLGQHFPSLTDKIMSTLGISQQFTDRPVDHSNESLHTSRGFHRAEGDASRDHYINRVSLYGMAVRNPAKAVMIFTAAAIGLGLLITPKKDSLLKQLLCGHLADP